MKNLETVDVSIYVLRDPCTYEIRYVGRTVSKLNVRLNGHLSKARKRESNSHKNCWLISLNKRPIIECFYKTKGWTKSHKEEKELISFLLSEGCNLVNADDRGEGGLNKIIGEEQKSKISKKLKKFYSTGILPPNAKDVTIFNLKGERLKYFKSLTECAKYIGVSNKHIQNSIKRKDKKLKKYQILLGDVRQNINPYINKRRYDFNNKKVFVYIDGAGDILEFDSVKETCEELDIQKSSFHVAKNKKRLYKNKYLFYYNKEELEKVIINLNN